VHRIAVELPVMATVAAIMASMVLIVGRSIEPPAHPVVLASHVVDSPTGDVGACLEAPVTALWATGAVGKGTLCYDGRDLRVALRVTDLAPGEVYAAWLGYEHQPAPCHDSPCGSVDLPSERPTGLMQQVVGGVSPPSRTLELDATLRDIRLLSGARVSLLLLRPTGRAGPHAQATFTIP
jgi:hypothetical protein